MKDCLKAFKILDKDRDGALSKHELTKAYEATFG